MLTTLYAGTQPRAVGQGEVYLTESMVDHIVARESLGEAGHDEVSPRLSPPDPLFPS